MSLINNDFSLLIFFTLCVKATFLASAIIFAATDSLDTVVTNNECTSLNSLYNSESLLKCFFRTPNVFAAVDVLFSIILCVKFRIKNS